MNRLVLNAAGIVYPQAGRTQLGEGLFTPGHHEIAFEAMNSSSGTALAAVFEEVARANARTVVVSSEELGILLGYPGTLEKIVGGFATLGYRPMAIVYLREQPYFAESLYAEFAKGGYAIDVRTYFDTILNSNTFTPGRSQRTIFFRYTQLIDRLASVFGTSNVIVRPYRAGREPEALLRDFLAVLARIAGELDLHGLVNPMPRANESLTFEALLSALCTLTGGDPQTFLRSHYPDLPPSELQTRFCLLTYDDVARFYARFGEDNARVNEMCRIDIPFSAREHLPANDDRFRRAEIHRDILSRLFETFRG